MGKGLMAVISLSVFVLLVFAAVQSWRKRISNQSASFSRPMEALEFFGEILGQSKCFYVATTYAANQLERIAAYGLGARGNGQILIFSEGVLIIRNGEVPLAIPRQAIIGLETKQVTIDKAVEPGGLISIQWIQEKTELATQLRIVDTDSRKIILSNISNLLAGSNSGRVAK